jgi:hypothetical protein
VFGSSHILGKPHKDPTSHTLKKCGKIPLGLPTCGSHFEELTLGKFGNIVWQSVALLGLKPNIPTKTGFGVGTLSRYKLGPRHTEHINQLSHFHAKKLSVLNFVRFDQALYFFFDKKSFVKNFLCQNLVCYKQIEIPRLLGGFLYEAILLAYDY